MKWLLPLRVKIDGRDSINPWSATKWHCQLSTGGAYLTTLLNEDQYLTKDARCTTSITITTMQNDNFQGQMGCQPGGKLHIP